MSILVMGWKTPPALYLPTVSAGGADDPLRRVLADTKRALRQAASSAQSLALSSLARVLEECTQPGWDGYGARAVSVQVAKRVEEFLDALPFAISSPEIVPEPDGELAVDWDFGPNLQLSISIGESGPLHFAGVIGEQRVRHGTEPFEGMVGGDLLHYILDLHERAGALSHRRAA